jgi:NTP pyrophosphatase (non-canonical NTP hydrolase)
MQPNEYQALALVTEFTPDFVRLEGATPEHNLMVAKLLHATLGLVSEAGEIADALKKHIIYGRELDVINMLEEAGDQSWYVALLLTAIKRTYAEMMEININKLRVRYGAKFEAHAALNRDLGAERQALEGSSDLADENPMRRHEQTR